MSKYVETLVGDNGSILIELSDDLNVSQMQPDVVKASPSIEQITEKAKYAFNKVIQQTQIMAKEFSEKIKDMEKTPEEIEMSFSIKLDASANTIIAKAGSEAQFYVTFKWIKTI